MTKSPVSKRSAVRAREPRPFLHLKPASLPLRETPGDAAGLSGLERALSPAIGHVVRSLVDYTIARQNRLDRGRAQPIALSVLNRRRRAARSWCNAIAAGRADAATRHAVATQWLPLLCGTGPDLRRAVRPARELVEFARGAVTACIFDAPSENLLPQAKALFALESTLAAHLAAVLQHGAARATTRV